ncbi:MAG: transglutaminase-like domain-containing protein [Faecalibacterium sp.]|jgi:transglutaminase-like putative cysteine protease|nr:transglutaminase-like domain-containing protein [Faecalibacterium sp.]
MNWNETLHSLNVGLPEDIARLKAAGCYREAAARIDERLAENWAAAANGPAADPCTENAPALPAAMKNCLLAEREILRRIPADYPFTEAQAVRRVQEHIPNFTQREFRGMVAANRIDWRFIEGERRYFRRFYESLLYTDPAFAARAGKPQSDETHKARRAAARTMREKGSLTARITVRFTLRADEKAFEDAKLRAIVAGHSAVTAKVWLPMPAACPAQSEIEALGFSAPPQSVAPADAPQRTVYWEKALTENETFTAEYRYCSTALYHDPLAAASAARVEFLAPETCLGEQAPHLVFTPYLRALTAEVTAGAPTDAKKAQRIYDWITRQVQYRYMPSYFTLEAIPDACARDRRGDCGVQALTFVTMCRIAGIPAVWQSGLMAGPHEAGCHDWAMFYLADQGWMYADCSFGGGAARAGDEALRRHYFGNLDPYRMVANRAFEAPLTPPKTSWRADPYDNQGGEIELEGVGLTGQMYDTEIELVKLELL